MRQHEVGVVLSDQRMPDTTGVQLLEQIRSEFPDTVRMLVTAYADLGGNDRGNQPRPRTQVHP